MDLGEKPRFSPSLALVVSLVAVSTASILIRLTEAPPMAIATWRLTLSSLMLLPFFIYNDGFQKLRIMNRQDLLALVGVGVALAVHFATWITSLSLTSVTSSVIFVHVDPIFVALVSHFLLRERVEPQQIIGIAIAFLGVSVIAYGDLNLGKESLIGDALSLIGALALGIYIVRHTCIRHFSGCTRSRKLICRDSFEQLPIEYDANVYHDCYRTDDFRSHYI
jgi:drug/metabolite transporter (DMT)-like permease